MEIDDIYSVERSVKSPGDLYPGEYVEGTAADGTPFAGDLITQPLQSDVEPGTWSFMLEKAPRGPFVNVTTASPVKVIKAVTYSSFQPDDD